MILHHPVPWKNTIAFCILFDVRDLGIDETHEGLLHFAEHLMFVETKKYKSDKLYEKHSLLFDVLEAHTSIDFLTIDVVCARSDFKEVCQVLKEMVYFWQCNQKQFLQEQQAIVEEIKISLEEPGNKATKALGNHVFDSKINVIGNVKRVESLNYKHLKEIQAIWKRMLDKSPRNVLVASSRLSLAERRILVKLFDVKKHSQRNISPSSVPVVARYISYPTVGAVIVDTSTSTPFFLILQRLYFVRWVRLNPCWTFSFNRETSHLVFMVHKSTSNEFDIPKSRHLLLDIPTAEEFAVARDIIVKHIDSLIDGINPQEIIAWLDIFYLQNIPQLEDKTLEEIREIFKSYRYLNFLKEWKSIIKVEYEK